MNCQQADPWIQSGMDGRLSPGERAQLDRHLAACTACRAAWDEYRQLGQAATAWARRPLAEDPGEVFNARILAQIAVPTAAGPAEVPPARVPGHLRSWRPVWLALAFVAVATLSAGTGFYLPRHTPLLTLPALPTLTGLVAGLEREALQVPRGSIQFWHILVTTRVSLSPWLAAALLATLAANAVFAWRTLRDRQEMAS